MIISIQSSVAYGFVGNSAAAYLLQASGAEVHPLHTATLSGHVGRNGWTGRITTPQELATLWAGLRAHGRLAACSTILSGYLGSAEIGEWLKSETDRLPNATFVCDPVMGDHGRLYVNQAIADFYKNNLASIYALTPNHFELSYLSEVEIKSLPDAQRAVQILHAKGVEVIVAKGLQFQDNNDTLTVLVSAPYDQRFITHPRRSPGWVGTGDAFSALLVAGRVRGLSWFDAASAASKNLLEIIDKTIQAGRADGELHLPGFVPQWTHSPAA